MAKTTAEQLEIAKAWAAWGDRLGWKFLLTGTDGDEPYGLFQTATGRTEKIRLSTREALDRGRPKPPPDDQDKPSNVAKIGAA